MSKVHEQLSPKEKGQMIRMEELLADKKERVTEIAEERKECEAKEAVRAERKAERTARAEKDERVTVDETVRELGKAAESVGALVRKGGRRVAKRTQEAFEQAGEALSRENVQEERRRRKEAAEETGRRIGRGAGEASRKLKESAEETGKYLRGKAERAGVRARRGARELGIDTDGLEQGARKAGRRAAAAADRVQDGAKRLGARAGKALQRAGEGAGEVTRRGRKRVEEAVEGAGRKRAARANVTLQYQEIALTAEEIEARVRESVREEGIRIRSLDIYVKPEERKAYYVINQGRMGEVSL